MIIIGIIFPLFFLFILWSENDCWEKFYFSVVKPRLPSQQIWWDSQLYRKNFNANKKTLILIQVSYHSAKKAESYRLKHNELYVLGQ